jgi:hypothetical protein
VGGWVDGAGGRVGGWGGWGGRAGGMGSRRRVCFQVGPGPRAHSSRFMGSFVQAVAQGLKAKHAHGRDLETARRSL